MGDRREPWRSPELLSWKSTHYTPSHVAVTVSAMTTSLSPWVELVTPDHTQVIGQEGLARLEYMLREARELVHECQQIINRSHTVPTQSTKDAEQEENSLLCEAFGLYLIADTKAPRYKDHLARNILGQYSYDTIYRALVIFVTAYMIENVKLDVNATTKMGLVIETFVGERNPQVKATLWSIVSTFESRREVAS